MVTVIAIAAAVLLFVGILKVTGICIKILRDLVDELRLERQLLGLQKEVLSKIGEQITLQRSIIEKQITLAMNAIMSMKLLLDKEKDPQWVEKFEQGRDNAKWN